MATMPRVLVDAPERVRQSHGLFSVLPFGGGADGRWVGSGVEYVAQTCAPAGGIPGYDCDPAVTPPLVTDDGTPTPTGGEGDSFSIFGWFRCGPMSLGDAQEKADAHLLAREEERVEQAFWTGDLGNQPNLTMAERANLGSFAATEAVVQLEQWGYNTYGSAPILHTSVLNALRLTYGGVFEVKEDRLQTKFGTPVVAGAGYPDTAEIVATGQMSGFRTEIEAVGANDLSGFSFATNDNVAYSWRHYTLTIDSCGLAVATITQ